MPLLGYIFLLILVIKLCLVFLVIRHFYIVTSKYKDVKDYIINNLGHTATIVNAKGGYSSKSKKMILCVVSTTEYIKMKEVIKKIDKDAFFLITDSYSVTNKI
ncbi:MAG: YitT family protein [Bacilli bacterium]|nr:MAG: YitT family protein [Bacilli bacterium]